MASPLTVHTITAYAHPTALLQPPSSASVPAALEPLTKPAPSSAPVPHAAHAPATAAPSSMTCSLLASRELPPLHLFPRTCDSCPQLNDVQL